MATTMTFSSALSTLRFAIFCCLSSGLAIISATAHAQGSPTSPAISAIQKNIASARYSQALQLAETQLSLQPQDFQAQFLRGVALSELGRTVQAIQAFEQLIESSPEMPEPYNNLAVLHAQQGDLEQAKQALEMAIRTKPDYAIAYENLGDIYARLAVRHYQRAYTLEQDNPPLHKKLSTLEQVANTAPQVYKPVVIPAKKTSTLPF